MDDDMKKDASPSTPGSRVASGMVALKKLHSEVENEKAPEPPIPSGTTSPATEALVQPEDPSTKEPKLPKLPEMPEEFEDNTSVVSEKELEPFHKPSKELFNPIVSVEDFFNNDISLLDQHSIEQSPCFPIIGSRTDEIPGNVVDNDGNVVDKISYPNIVYYCKLHPDLGSTFLEEIELHCRQKEQDIHRAEILRIMEHDTTQQHGKGEST